MKMLSIYNSLKPYMDHNSFRFISVIFFILWITIIIVISNVSALRADDVNDGGNTQENAVTKDVNVQSTEINNVANTQNTLEDDELITIGTSATYGVYYPAGNIICLFLNHEYRSLNLRCKPISTAGSIDNIKLLKSAEVTLGFAQSDWQKHAVFGTAIFSNDGPNDKLRFLFSLHDEVLTIVVRQNSNIKSLDDLKGKVVNIGAVGSGVRATMDTIIKAKKWDQSVFKSVTVMRSSDQIRALCNGQIDAMVTLIGHPNDVIKEVTSTCETTIINLTDSDITEFVNQNNEYNMSIIEGGVYNGVPFDVTSMGVRGTVLSTSENSTENIYKIVKVVFENFEQLKRLHPAFKKLTVAKMLTTGQIAPMHPGASQYFKEVGYINPDGSINANLK